MATRRPPELAVWVADVHVADLIEPRTGQLRLRYTPSALDSFGIGGIALSASLPVRGEPYSVGETRPFLEGLLPEGEARTRIERQFGIPRGNTYRLLEAIGRDCAGAVAVLPSGSRPVDDLARADEITEKGLAEEIADLPEHPLGVEEDVRLSLAGMQDKLLVARLPNGRWARPRDGTPSTHILKPEPTRCPGLVVLEAFGLRLAEAAGLPAASAEVLHLPNDRPVLAVARYDRRVDDAKVHRIHQEDMCQALGILPDRKYESDGGPSFRQIAALVRRISTQPRDDLRLLVGTMALTVALGNTDAHGRNLSLLYERPARRLAPLYDVIPTLAVHPRDGEPRIGTRLAMHVNGVTDIRDVTGADLLAEAGAWRVPPAAVRDALAAVLHRIVDSAATVADDLAAAGAPVPGDAIELVPHRAAKLAGEM